MEERTQSKICCRHAGRQLSRSLKIVTLLLLTFLIWESSPSVLRADEAAILAQFYPYSQGIPRVPGLEPEVTLSPANAHLAKEVLLDEVFRLLTAEELAITIQGTTNLPPRQSYIDATLKHSQGVTLTDQGILQNYDSGLPFPLLDPADPQAGEKMAWNFRYRDLGETFEMRPTTQEMNASSAVEHFDRGILRIRFGMHRPNPADNDPQWQQEGVWQKNSFEVLSPSDREGVMRILTIYDSDTRAAEQWRYAPQTRRVRKDYVNYLTPIGGTYEALQEEAPPFIFNGYLYQYRWVFLGARVMLVPGFARTSKLQFGGKHGWYPEVPWELRRVFLLECTPKETHPLGRRVFILDQQTYTPLLVLTYAHDGTFFRLTISAHVHPHFHPQGNSISLPLLNGGTMINFARQRATLQSAGDSTVHNPPLAAHRFELMEILRRGK